MTNEHPQEPLLKNNVSEQVKPLQIRSKTGLNRQKWYSRLLIAQIVTTSIMLIRMEIIGANVKRVEDAVSRDRADLIRYLNDAEIAYILHLEKHEMKMRHFVELQQKKSTEQSRPEPPDINVN